MLKGNFKVISKYGGCLHFSWGQVLHFCSPDHHGSELTVFGLNYVG